jgi:hypothetical protein
MTIIIRLTGTREAMERTGDARHSDATASEPVRQILRIQCDQRTRWAPHPPPACSAAGLAFERPSDNRGCRTIVIFGFNIAGMRPGIHHGAARRKTLE